MRPEADKVRRVLGLIPSELCHEQSSRRGPRSLESAVAIAEVAMKLEPVYLVAPRPTRRAFLLAGGAFAGGVVVGGAGGFAIGVNSVAVPAAPESFERSGNAELDDLRRLAVEAPIEELLERAPEFITSVNRTFPEDRVLVRGLQRLGERVISDEGMASRSTLARFLVRTAKVGAAARDTAFLSFVPPLEAILK